MLDLSEKVGVFAGTVGFHASDIAKLKQEHKEDQERCGERLEEL